MSDHPNPERLRAFIQGQLTPGELLALDDHLASCGSCRGLAAVVSAHRVDQISFALTSAETSFHIPHDRIAATPLAAEESTHLEDCSDCRELRGELAALQEQIDQGRAAPKWSGRARPPLRRGMQALLAASLVIVVTTLVTRSMNQQQSVTPQAPPAIASQPQIGEELRDGDRVIVIEPSGRVAGLRQITPPVEDAIQRLMSGSVAVSSELRGRPAVLLGPGGDEATAKLISPVGTVVREEKPTFRWKITVARRVQVDLYDRNFERVASSGPLDGSEWTCSKLLRRGEMYRWQVRYRDGDNEIVVPATTSADARFAVLSKSALEELAREERAHAGSHLALGALYADLGLLDEAERELTAFAAANPASMLPRRLLDSLNRLRE